LRAEAVRACGEAGEANGTDPAADDEDDEEAEDDEDDEEAEYDEDEDGRDEEVLVIGRAVFGVCEPAGRLRGDFGGSVAVAPLLLPTYLLLGVACAVAMAAACNIAWEGNSN